MKKGFVFVTIILIMALILGSAAMAEEIDLSGMSYDELVELKDRINKAMWECEEWQEVTVPQGTWLVGEDIPAGHWTILPCEGYVCLVKVGDVLEENKKDISHKSTNYSLEFIGSGKPSFSIELFEGDYVEVEQGDAVFTPYSGKPSLGFK